jgi:hypothetical protein
VGEDHPVAERQYREAEVGLGIGLGIGHEVSRNRAKLVKITRFPGRIFPDRRNMTMIDLGYSMVPY